MKQITLFLIYLALSLACIIYLLPIYDIIGVTIITVLYTYIAMIDDRIYWYKALRRKVIRAQGQKEGIFLCVASYHYPPQFRRDLKNRLRYYDIWYSDIPRVCSYYTSAEMSEKNYPFWNTHDYESRLKFLDRVIEKLEKDEKRH